MAKLGDPTDFSYRVNKVIKVVDGDTIDVMLDLGFDIMYKSRVRLFGIDTPESRTSDKTEKKYGLMSTRRIKEC
jgi:micrococcal nuclease